MRDTSNFRTKTKFLKRDNGNIPGQWLIALDIGYSGVKIESPNIVARFPSYAKKVESDLAFAGEVSEKTILYKDLDTNEMWLVGEVAQNIMSANDKTASETSLYGREWFRSPKFKVLADVGYGIAMQKAEFTNNNGENYTVELQVDDRIIVQTGLPEKYMANTEEMQEVLSGRRHFAIKIGTGEWKNYDKEIFEKNIYVMSQPKGTLFSVCIDKNKKFHPDAKKYMSKSCIIFDAGFGTLDIFPIKSGVVGKGETYPDLGMKRVLQITTAGIKQQFDVDIPVPAMQKYLETGTVRYKSRKKAQFVSKEFSFGDILAKASEDVCDEAIERMSNVLDLLEYDYMIVTGGTGAAWFNHIKEIFKDFETLQIIQGNQNDDLPFVYANVRGYYNFRYNKLIMAMAS